MMIFRCLAGMAVVSGVAAIAESSSSSMEELPFMMLSDSSAVNSGFNFYFPNDGMSSVNQLLTDLAGETKGSFYEEHLQHVSDHTAPEVVIIFDIEDFSTTEFSSLVGGYNVDKQARPVGWLNQVLSESKAALMSTTTKIIADPVEKSSRNQYPVIPVDIHASHEVDNLCSNSVMDILTTQLSLKSLFLEQHPAFNLLNAVNSTCMGEYVAIFTVREALETASHQNMASRSLLSLSQAADPTHDTLRITPTILVGLLISFMLIYIASTGLGALNTIQTPSVWMNKEDTGPAKGKEY